MLRSVQGLRGRPSSSAAESATIQGGGVAVQRKAGESISSQFLAYYTTMRELTPIIHPISPRLCRGQFNSFDFLRVALMISSSGVMAISARNNNVVSPTMPRQW